MLPDEYGFFYPAVDAALCTGCGICRSTCPYHRDSECGFYKPIRAFAAVNRNAEVLKASSSGGAFSAIAELVIEKGGLIFGCTLDSGFTARHISAETLTELDKLRGSKYFQSSMSLSYSEAKSALQSGRLVLFVGMPCQIAGLRAFLQDDYGNLLTIDLFCHGITSGDFFLKYVGYMEEHYKAKLIGFKCRDKSRMGWGQAGLAIMERNGNAFGRSLWPRINYYYYYVRGYTYRETCYDCRYAQIARPSDFTIGDFWHIEEVLPSLPRKDGVSILLINTKKGLEILEAIKEKMALTEVKMEDIASSDSRLYEPCLKSEIRKEVLDHLNDKGFKKTANRFFGDNWATFVKAWLSAHIPVKLKKRIKTLTKGLSQKVMGSK